MRAVSKDGLSAKCKVCQSDYDRSRNKDEKRVRAREEYQKGKGRKIASSCKARYIERNKKKRRVHIITGNAIRDGVIKKRKCEVCGDKNVHAHHDDYDKPLSVRFLCPQHHKEWHKDNGPGLNCE